MTATIDRPDVLEDIVRVARGLGVSPLTLGARQYKRDKGVKVGNDTLSPWADWKQAAADFVGLKGPSIEADEIPSESRPVSEIIEARRKEFNRRKARIDAQESYTVRVSDSKPVGLWIFGDPHLDDPGCDIDLIMEHARIVRETPGMFAANIGDSTNNWVGRLGRLYASQTTTETEAFELAKHFVGEVRDWLFMIRGNHDIWHGESRDPVDWFCRSRGTAYAHEIGLRLEFQNGAAFKLNARHCFKGHSQWNKAHGQTKSVRMEGGDWHVKVSGHTHVTGYNPVYTPDLRRLTHCVQVGSYKQYDTYAETNGFVNENWSPGACLIFDPQAEAETRKVQVIWDLPLAAQVLGFMRGESNQSN